MNPFLIRTGLGLLFLLSGTVASIAVAPQAHINVVPAKVSVASVSDIRFAHISTADGILQTRVSDIVQDNLGFMWFGTVAGLIRFDGYSFKVFVHEKGNPNSLSGVDVSSLFKDRDGALWIGCEESLDRFDPRTETFTHFPLSLVKKISQDHAGLLWFSAGKGLYQLDQKNGKFRVYLHDPGDAESLPNNNVVSAAEDRTGRFWVAEPSGIHELDRKTGHIKLSIPLPTVSRDISFYEDRSGGFWIIYGTGNGLAKFDRDRNILTYYSFHPGDIESTAETGMAAVLEDRHGDLWFGTRGYGLVKYDREHSQFTGYTYNPGEPDGLAENRVLNLFEDRDGSIWVSLFGTGLQRFSPVAAQFSQWD